MSVFSVSQLDLLGWLIALEGNVLGEPRDDLDDGDDLFRYKSCTANSESFFAMSTDSHQPHEGSKLLNVFS